MSLIRGDVVFSLVQLERNWRIGRVFAPYMVVLMDSAVVHSSNGGGSFGVSPSWTNTTHHLEATRAKTPHRRHYSIALHLLQFKGRSYLFWYTLLN